MEVCDVIALNWNARPMTAFDFSTDEFPEHERISAWREMFGAKIVKLDMEPPKDQPFRGRVTIKALPDLAIGSIASTANRISRTPSLIADGGDDIMLGVVLNGVAKVSQAGHEELTVGCGDAVVWSNSSVGHSFYNAPIELLSVAVPRSVLDRHRVHPDRMTFSLLPRDSAALSLLTKYLQVMLRESIPLETQTVVTAHIHELMAMILGHGSENDSVPQRLSMRAVRMHAIKSDIAANLRNRQLTINAVAARHGISARYIRELFASENTTFTEYVLGRRLEHAHRLLMNPQFADHNISAIAFESGFGDVSHFNHTFRERYQSTPTAVRIAALKK
jgi:AraC-like DNA-binding protein